MLCDICHKQMVPLVKDLWKCKHDGLVSSSLKARVEMYDESYCKKYLDYARTNVDVDLQNIRVNFILKNTQDFERGKLLDFGSGNGSFLRNLDGHFGIKRGFDINPFQQFTRIDFLLDQYDVVTFWDTIEHLESPASFLKGIKTKYVFISFPSLDAIREDKILGWKHYRPHEHIHYYNKKSAEKLLNACGYSMVDFNYNESKVRTGGGDKNIISVCGLKND